MCLKLERYDLSLSFPLLAVRCRALPMLHGSAHSVSSKQTAWQRIKSASQAQAMVVQRIAFFGSASAAPWAIQLRHIARGQRQSPPASLVPCSECIGSSTDQTMTDRQAQAQAIRKQNKKRFGSEAGPGLALHASARERRAAPATPAKVHIREPGKVPR